MTLQNPPRRMHLAGDTYIISHQFVITDGVSASVQVTEVGGVDESAVIYLAGHFPIDPERIEDFCAKLAALVGDSRKKSPAG